MELHIYFRLGGICEVTGYIESFQICSDHLPCEIDPARLREGENINDNMVTNKL